MIQHEILHVLLYLGMNFDVKNLKADSVHRPCYCVFDILYLNGKTITNKPLSERVRILDNLFEPIKGVIEKSRRVEVNTKYDFYNYEYCYI